MREFFARLFAKPGIAAELIAASLFANILALASPLFVIQVLNRYVAHGVDATLATLTVGVVVACFLEFAFRQVRMRLAATLNVVPDQRASVAGFAVLVGAKAGVLERMPPGRRREIINGAAAIQAAYGAPNITAVLDVPFAFLFIGALALLNAPLAGIAAGFIAVVFVVGVFSLVLLRGPTRRLVEVGARAGELVGIASAGVDTVRAFNAAGFLRQAWQGSVQMAQSLARRVAAGQGFIQSFTQLMVALMSTTVVAVGALLVVKGHMDVGTLMGANILAARALQPISRFALLGEAFAKARSAIELLREFARLPREAETGSAKTEYRGSLELRDLAFTHPEGNTPLFESLSLKLGPGAVLVVTGGNGTGKTTLARLLTGVLEPSRGHVLVDGLDLRQALPEWWRRQLVYLPQEPAFLSATIAENLALARPGIDADALNRAIDAAGLRRFIDESPQGFDTRVVEDGRHLSLGIRRRLALARALASDGMLAILDEPTEGLDAEGTAAVHAAIAELVRRGRTMIICAHDPSAFKGANAVLDLNSKPVPRLTAVPRPVQPPAVRAEKGEAAP